MMSAEQIFQAIRSLPLSERRGLFERLRDDLKEPSTARAPSGTTDEGIRLIGFLTDEPEIADEIEKIATVERAGEDMRGWEDAARSSR